MVNKRGYDNEGNRMALYKEDSTKGGARMQPLNYKGDVLTQVWVDGRILATLSRWLEKNDYYPRSMSEVVREPLRILVETLVDNGHIEMVEDTIEAREHLQRRFRVDLSRGGRGIRNQLHNQILSEERKELNINNRENIQPFGPTIRGKEAPKWIPIPEYPEYLYMEGNEEMMKEVSEKAKKAGVKSLTEIKADNMEMARSMGMIANSKEKNNG